MPFHQCHQLDTPLPPLRLMSHEIGVGPGVPDLVSVVIPTYNRAYVLGEAISSALRQTHLGIEVVVVDDGSTDDTRSLVESFGKSVRYFRQENAGVSAARNLGLLHSRGEFIALLDSDDTWLPGKVAAQVEIFRRHPDVGMVWTDMSAVSGGGDVIHRRYLKKFYGAYESVRTEEIFHSCSQLGSGWMGGVAEGGEGTYFHGDIFSPMLLGNLVHTSTVMLSRERLRRVGGFDLTLSRSGEDYEYHLRTCSFGEVAFLDAPTTRYRIGVDDQLTAPRFEIDVARNNLTTILRWFALGKERVSLPPETISTRLSAAYGWLGELELQLGAVTEGRTHLLECLRRRPLQPRRVALVGISYLPRPIYLAAQEVSHRMHGVGADHTARGHDAEARDRTRALESFGVLIPLGFLRLKAAVAAFWTMLLP